MKRVPDFDYFQYGWRSHRMQIGKENPYSRETSRERTAVGRRLTQLVAPYCTSTEADSLVTTLAMTEWGTFLLEFCNILDRSNAPLFAPDLAAIAEYCRLTKEHYDIDVVTLLKSRFSPQEAPGDNRYRPSVSDAGDDIKQIEAATRLLIAFGPYVGQSWWSSATESLTQGDLPTLIVGIMSLSIELRVKINVAELADIAYLHNMLELDYEAALDTIVQTCLIARRIQL